MLLGPLEPPNCILPDLFSILIFSTHPEVAETAFFYCSVFGITMNEAIGIFGTICQVMRTPKRNFQ